MVGRVVGLHLRRVLFLPVIGSRDREVRRVVEHIAFLGVDIDLQIADAERSALMNRIRHLFDRVFLMFCVVGVECLFEFDVRIERVIVRTSGLVTIRHIEWHLNLRFLREESSSFECGTHVELVEILHVSVKHIGLNRAVTGGLQTTGYIHLRNVANREGRVRHCCYTALLVELA